jgi:hypothetical protein
MRRFARNPVCGTNLATFGPIHARIGLFRARGAGNVADLLAIDGLEVHIADQPQNAEPLPVPGH